LQNNGIATEIFSLINNEEVRPTSNLIISKGSAYDYLNNSNPNLEKLTTQYYETFAITGRFSGYFSNITIGDFYNNLSSKYCDPTAILGGLNSTARQKEDEINSKQKSENQEDVITNPEDLTAGTSSIVGDRGTENFGIAVFNEDKLCGELTATESICHLLITNKLDSCIISIDNPISEKETKKIEIQLFPSKKTKINLNIVNDIPHISLQLSLNADIMTLDTDVNYEANNVLSKISEATEQYLKTQFNDYLNKVTKQYNVDIDDFCLKGPAHFSTISEWENFNWDEKFKNTEFDINIDINVLSTILITKT
jgi:spore germination protein KC